MQFGVTATRDERLIRLAEYYELSGSGMGLLLRESRLDVYEVPDESYLAYAPAIGELLAQQHAAANPVRVARLTIPAEEWTWVYAIDEVESLEALLRNRAVADNLELVQAEKGELPVADRQSPVRPCEWKGMWFRSQSELRIAQAFDRANVLFAPNVTLRVGTTPDDRSQREVDFLVSVEGKTGVLEVDGEPFHAAERAAEEHERDRSLRKHGIRLVERYDADRCFNFPDDTVAEFLALLIG